MGEVLTWQLATGFLRATLLRGVYCSVNPWRRHKQKQWICLQESYWHKAVCQNPWKILFKTACNTRTCHSCRHEL